jgi:hypothetical protein
MNQRDVRRLAVTYACKGNAAGDLLAIARAYHGFLTAGPPHDDPYDDDAVDDRVERESALKAAIAEAAALPPVPAAIVARAEAILRFVQAGD